MLSALSHDFCYKIWIAGSEFGTNSMKTDWWCHGVGKFSKGAQQVQVKLLELDGQRLRVLKGFCHIKILKAFGLDQYRGRLFLIRSFPPPSSPNKYCICDIKPLLSGSPVWKRFQRDVKTLMIARSVISSTKLQCLVTSAVSLKLQKNRKMKATVP